MKRAALAGRLLGLTVSALCLAVLTPGLLERASAQVGGGLDLSWFTLDGGGATSIAGGVYSIGGTVGQPDAGRASGGTYALLSGFWGVADTALPTLAIDDVTLAEGNSGTTAFVFTVTLSAPSSASVTVNAQTVADTAASPSDFTAIPTTLMTFPPQSTRQTLTVLVNGDAQNESDERFFVTLSAAANATIADGQGVGTIRNDDGSVPTGTPTATPTATPTGTLTPTVTATTTATPTPPLTHLPPSSSGQKRDDDDTSRRPRRDQGSEDDTRTEGNVVEIRADATPPVIFIASMDGVVELRLFGRAREMLPSVTVGQYVVATGTKEHEQLYDIDDLSIE